MGSSMSENRSKAVPVALLLSVIAFLFDGFVAGYVFLSGLLFFAVLLLLPIYLLLAIFKIGRNTAKGLFVILVCSFGSMAYCDWLDSVAVARAEPVVLAIERYRTNEGKYPASLNDLVPKYVNFFPDLKPTGNSPKLEYEQMGSGPILAFKNGVVFSRKVYEFWSGNWVTYD